MKAVQFDCKKRSLSLAAIDVPKAERPDDVVLRVGYAGICGSDLHVMDGHMSCSEIPVTMGHEFSAVVVGVGSAVTHVKVGDKVVVDPNDACRKCTFCTGGQPHFCTSEGPNNNVGNFKDGGWAEYCKVPSQLVYKLPSDVPLSVGALCEPLSCVAHGWDRLGHVPHSSKVLIMGAGIIGNLWAAVFHLHGHRKVTISEPQETRRKLAEKLGTGYEVVAPTEIKKRVAVSDWGVDVVVDCTGCSPAMEEAMGYLRPGGRYLIFGVAPPEAKVAISPYMMFKKELTIIGVIVNPFTFNKAIGLVEAMGSKYLQFEKLGIKAFSLEQYKEAIDTLRKGAIAKAMFKIHDKESI